MKAQVRSVEHRVVQLHDRYRKLSFRERVLVTLSLLSVTWMVWNITIGGFLESSKARIHRDTGAVYAQLQSEVAEQARLQAVQANDPNVRLGKERAALDDELKNLNQSLVSVLERFVAPEKMPELLKDVIRHHDGLKLKRMVSLPVEPIELVAEQPAAGSTAPDAPDDLDVKMRAPPVYRHPLRLEFVGNYFEVLAYLDDLEQSEWKFGWRQLTYVVDDYPLAVVTLEIETLSRKKSWIGV